MSSEDLERRSRAFTSASVPANYERYLAPVVFEPWAEVLVDTAGLRAGGSVLDIASGTGVVARLAARRVGPEGRVVASDLSGPMLDQSRGHGGEPGAAPIEFLEASALELPLADAEFDCVLCQQGLQFFPDRAAAVAQARRVLVPGGTFALSTWALGYRLEPFQEYSEALQSVGVPEPFPGAFDPTSLGMAPAPIDALLRGGGFDTVETRIVELELDWPDAESAARGIVGTPFGPLLDALTDTQRENLYADLAERFRVPVGRTSAAVVARALAPLGL